MSKLLFGKSERAEHLEPLEFGDDWGSLPMAQVATGLLELMDFFDRKEVKDREEERREGIKQLRDYYEGRMHKPLKTKIGEVDDNIMLNLCRPMVEDSVSWLFGEPDREVIKFQVLPPVVEMPDDELDDEAIETMRAEREQELDLAAEIIEDLFKRSGGFHFFKRLGIRGSVAGHYFLKIVPNETGSENNIEKVVVLDPLRVTVRTDPSDVTKAIAYKVEWKRKLDLVGRSRETWIFRQVAMLVDPVDDREDRWIVADLASKDRSKREWEIRGGPWAWDYPFPPIMDGPNLMAAWGYYGSSDLEDIAPLNDSINFVTSNYGRILKIHAHPKTIGTGFQLKELVDTAIDGFWSVANPNAKVQNLEMESDLQSSLNMLELLRTEFWSIGRGLDPAVYKDKIGKITNFGLRVIANRALHKNTDKRMSYGEALRELGRAVLEMEGMSGYDVQIMWPEPLPEDPMEQIVRAEREEGLGVVSVQTLAEELGRSWEQEKRRIRRQKEENVSLGQWLVSQFDQSPFGSRANQVEPPDNDEEDEEEG